MGAQKVGESLPGREAIAPLRAVLGGVDGHGGASKAAGQAGEQSVALLQGQGSAGADVEAQLDA